MIRTSLGKRLLIGLGSLVALDQVLLHTLFWDGVVLGHAVAPYERALFTEHQRHVREVFERTLEQDRARFDKRSQFDPDLGWCPRPGEKRARAEFDWSGSRLGTSQFPPLYDPRRTRTIYFKPRFSLAGNGGPMLHRSPVCRPDDVIRLLHDPVAFRDALGANDPWLARAPAAYALAGAHWSHYSALTRIVLTVHESGGRDTSALLRDASSDLCQPNRAIMLQLAQEVKAAGVASGS